MTIDAWLPLINKIKDDYSRQLYRIIYHSESLLINLVLKFRALAHDIYLSFQQVQDYIQKPTFTTYTCLLANIYIQLQCLQGNNNIIW